MRRTVKVKPGKGQSLAGFMAGLIFCGIGLFVVIPNAGPFGIVWTLFALIITIVNGYNAFTEKGVPSHEIIIDEQDSSVFDGSDEKSPEQRLAQLHSLYEKSLVSQEEYDNKRREILGDI